MTSRLPSFAANTILRALFGISVALGAVACGESDGSDDVLTPSGSSVGVGAVGVCSGEQTCTSSSCTLTAGEGSCELACGGSSSCTVAGGAPALPSEGTDTLTCGNTSSCELSAAGYWGLYCTDAATCRGQPSSDTEYQMHCEDDATCTLTCTAGSSCIMFCDGSKDCAMTCEVGASCSCSNAPLRPCTCTGPGCRT